MGGPERDIPQCRQRAESLIEAEKRLNDWRKQNSLPVPVDTPGGSIFTSIDRASADTVLTKLNLA